MGSLLGEGTAGLTEYNDRLSRLSPSLSSFIVFLGLKKDLVRQTGLKDTEVFLENSYDPDASYEACKRADAENCGLCATLYDNVFAGYSPKGKNTLTIMTLQGFEHWEKFEDDYRNGRKSAYRAEKQRIANLFIQRVEKALLPGSFQGDRSERHRHPAHQHSLHRELPGSDLRLGPDPRQLRANPSRTRDAHQESVLVRRMVQSGPRLRRSATKRNRLFCPDREILDLGQRAARAAGSRQRSRSWERGASCPHCVRERPVRAAGILPAVVRLGSRTHTGRTPAARCPLPAVRYPLPRSGTS